LIADLQKAPSIAKAQRLQKDLEVIRKDLGWLEPQPVLEGVAALAVGQTVKVRSLNQKGIIEDLPEDRTARDAQATVRAGAFKIKVPLTDLMPLQQQGPAAKPQQQHRAARTQFKSGGGNRKSDPYTRASAEAAGELDVFVRTSRNTIDLRGQRVDEALQNLESFIDAAFLERMSPVMIIHGHGTGAVKSAVRKFLTESPYGASFRSGENYEGGDGVTVVQFK
jgi:DNA mismatch repair protein MutS2